MGTNSNSCITINNFYREPIRKMYFTHQNIINVCSYFILINTYMVTYYFFVVLNSSELLLKIQMFRKYAQISTFHIVLYVLIKNIIPKALKIISTLFKVSL